MCIIGIIQQWQVPIVALVLTDVLWLLPAQLPGPKNDLLSSYQCAPVTVLSHSTIVAVKPVPDATG